MQAGLPHRTFCRPLIIHLAPKAGTDQQSLRVAPRSRVRGRRRSGPPGRATRRGAAIVPQCPQSHVASAISPGGTRRLGARGPPHRDLALPPYQKRQGRRAARVPRRARCAPGGVLGVREVVRHVARLPSADYPFGAKSRYGPTVASIRHPEPYEGRPATIDPMPVPLQRAAVSVPRTCPQHGQSAIVSPWQLVQ